MTDPLLIPCPHCNGLNRIPAARVGEHPKCGRCKNEVLIAKPFDLKQTDYASQIKGDLPLLVDVWAEWCGPCKAFAPVFEQAASQLVGVCRCLNRRPANWWACAGWPSSTAMATSNCQGNWAFARFRA